MNLEVLPKRSANSILLVIVLAAGCVAWRERWVQDDAYITFRYAANVVSGYGPVWNPGYAVEGYTNFLWMLLIASGMRFGVLPETFGAALGVACLAASLVLVYRVALRVFTRNSWALFVTALVATNYSFLMYATGGLETQLDATLTLALLLVTVEAVQEHRVTISRAFVASILMSLALLTRPDSGIVAAVTLGTLGMVVYRAWSGSRLPPTERAAVLASLLTPLLLIVGGWLVWKHSFYGRLLPNTFYVKVGGHRAATIGRGLIYTGWLAVSYWWLPIVLGTGLVGASRMPIRSLISLRTGELPLVVYAVTWLSYVIWVGGDIMEFRMLVPVIPIFLLLMVDLFSRTLADVRWLGAACLLVLAGSVVHGLWFSKYVRFADVGAIPNLEKVGNLDTSINWKVIGMRLREDLGSNTDVTMAVGPAGAIPYFSGARTIDVLGLNDVWVAQHGQRRKLCRVCFGHSRLATVDYVVGSGVNVIIGLPQYLSYANPVQDPAQVVKDMFLDEDMDYENWPEGTSLVRIRLRDDVAVAAAYIKRNAEVDRLLATGAWRSQPIEGAALVRRPESVGTVAGGVR